MTLPPNDLSESMISLRSKSKASMVSLFAINASSHNINLAITISLAVELCLLIWQILVVDASRGMLNLEWVVLPLGRRVVVTLDDATANAMWPYDLKVTTIA